MFADSTNTALCRCFSLVCVPFFLCADTTWWLSWDPYAPPFSPADKATTSRKQLDPLPSQLSHKKEKRKKKEEEKNTQRRDSHTGTSVIHQHDQDFRTLDLSAKLHQMTEDNSSCFGNFSANESHLSRGNDSSKQKRLLPVRTSRTLIAWFVSVSACNYI